MNVCLRNTMLSLWLALGAWSLSAQAPSFYFPCTSAISGTTKLVHLRAVNLDSVVSVQMVIRWDPKVLKYLNADNLNLGDMMGNDLNTTQAIDSGYIRIQWEGSNTPPGASIPDSSVFLRLRFTVIGPDTSSTPLKVTELLDFPPTYFEVIKVRPNGANEDYLLPECNITNGCVTVGFNVDSDEPLAEELPLSLSPNPFSETSSLKFELPETSDVQVIISDALGRTVFEKKIFNATSGQHGMVIEKGMLGAPGAYSLTLRAGRKIATRTLVLH